jgi:hypothetical protein
MSKQCILLTLIAVGFLFGCSGETAPSQNSSLDSAQPSNENRSAVSEQASDTQPEGKWVTVGIETGVFGPDGKQKRWVKLEAGRPIKLAKGEWVTLNGKKYTGRAGGRSQILMEAGQIIPYDVDVADG